jgi:small-conductance mechanosensitive channel
MDLQKLVTQDIGGLLTPDRLEKLLLAVVIALVGYLLLRVLAALVGRFGRKRLTPQSAMLARKAVFYLGAALLLVIVLRQLGFQLTALLGAAGIVGIAIGFASQTSVSNIISGLFLISEKPFAVGDAIKAGEHTGIVMSIDLLSVKIRTFDNQYIRIPNEKILSTDLTNITYFPIRRMDFNLSISYKNDLARAREALLDVADRNPFSLRDPAPVVIFTGFGDSGQELLFGVWFAKDDYIDLRNSIMYEIKQRFDAAGIEIPYPHHTIAGGLATDPIPVRLVGRGGGPARHR